MPYPTFPTVLPGPVITNHARQDSDIRRSVGADEGFPQYGRRLSLPFKVMPLTYRLDRARAKTLQTFFEVDLSWGVTPFWLPDPVYDGEPLLDYDFAPLLDFDDTPLLDTVNLLCKWGDTPPSEGDYRGMHLTVSFSVYVLPTP